MRFEDTISNRARRALIALAALATTAALAAPAQAASGEGTTTIALANGKGRTLSGQGVKILAGTPAAKSGNSVSLPISALEFGENANASVDGGLRFKRGKRAAVADGLRLDLAAGTLDGKLGGNLIPLFWLGGAAGVDATAGTVSLSGGKLRLTEAAALVLKQKLGLKKALKRTGVGSIAITAKAKPTEAAAKPIASGGATWGVRSELRGYILSPPAGSITLGDGATANGSLASPATVFGFPAAGGSFVKGLYGGADKLQLKLEGNVTLAKPAHCIAALRFANIEVELDGANSAITVDTTFDEAAPCPDEPPVVSQDVELGKLDLTGVTPSWSAGGKTVTWTAIPATITAAGSAAFGGFLTEGDALEPITISVTLG